ncbi:hypothetical protein Hanom_Chr02g00162021 [Helianthus anomalus]
MFLMKMMNGVEYDLFQVFKWQEGIDDDTTWASDFDSGGGDWW